MYVHPDFQAPIFCFSARTHQTGLFFIPKETKDAMHWAGDCSLNFTVFDASGRMRFQGDQSTTSGGEVKLGVLSSYELINVIVYQPEKAAS